MKDQELITQPCVGCGFCCLKAKCSAGQRLYPSATPCPALIWDENKNRYICDLMTLPGSIGFQYREELHANKGCCCNLNSWRKDVKNRTTFNSENDFLSLDPLFQKFLNHLSKEFISSDVIFLTLSSLLAELVRDGLDQEKAKKIVNLIHHKFKNSRSKNSENFMG